MAGVFRVAILGLIAAAGTAGAAPERNPVYRASAGAAAPPVSRLIVGMRGGVNAATRAAGGADDRVQALARRTGVALRGGRSIGPRLRVVDLESPMTAAEAAEVAARLAGDADVAFVEPDARLYHHTLPSDPLYPQQWYLQALQPAAIDAESAWDSSIGSAATVVAVLDTGVRFDHPDLRQAGRGGRLLPGYDFVGGDGDGSFRTANDGDGWDPNPADPGDWISAADAELPVFAGCDVGGSSWHGTRVAGLLGAITNNATGIAGTTWNTWILPVRVLGKCGGHNSDILQGMRWAAGLPVSGAPPNPYPASIINMSLGAPGSCSQSYLAVVDELAAAGVLVVASAGNSGGPEEYPANCPGVAGVVGLRHAGTKVGFSSLGPLVAIAAPGGNCVNLSGACLFSLDTTVDVGSTAPQGPGYTNQLDTNVGTSFSAPLVAGIAALMRAVNGNLRGAQLVARLQEGARPFPPPGAVQLCHVPAGSADIQEEECACSTATCGAGMASAPGAVAAARRPIAAVAVPVSVAPGQDVSLDASGSAAACNRSIAAYDWTPVSGGPTISGTNTPVATVIAPPSGAVTVRVTVTDDQGETDSADVVVTPSVASTSAPASAGTAACPQDITPPDPGPFVDDGPVQPTSTNSSGGDDDGGGGGALDPAAGAGLALLGLLGRRRRRRAGRHILCAWNHPIPLP